MKKHSVLFYIYYFVGICLTALIINCGSAGLDFKRRLYNPYFPYIYVCTVLEIALIVSYYSWLINYIKKFGSEFTKDLTHYRRTLISMMSLLPLVVLHLMLIKLLLLQRQNVTLASTGYFQKDFLFFIIPLFAYAVYIFQYPRYRLFKSTTSQDLKESERIAEEVTMAMQQRIDQLQSHYNNLDKEKHPTLLLWRTTFHIESLRKYIQDTAPLRDDSSFQFHDILFIEKIKKHYFMVHTNGQKTWLTDTLKTQLLDNPWLVEIKKGMWFNMLHTSPTLILMRDYRDQRWLRVDDKIWHRIRLESSIPLSDKAFESSRRYRTKFLDFWKAESLRTLDVNRLHEEYDWPETFRS